MEKDIEIRMKKLFGLNYEKARELIEDFRNRTNFGPRLIRCIISLSNGDIKLLTKKINDAKKDWRDVMAEAESVPLEYNQPFNEII